MTPETIKIQPSIEKSFRCERGTVNENTTDFPRLSYFFIVDLRINGTLQTGAVRKTKLPFYRLAGAVSNSAYSVRFPTAPTGGQKCSFIFNIHHNLAEHVDLCR